MARIQRTVLEKNALTGFTDTRFLVASHIKPWKDANNKERLDSFNGLLLMPNLDKVFDLGFITFKENGKIVISDYLEERTSAKVSIWLGACFGACDLPDSNADLVIQFGHAPW